MPPMSIEGSKLGEQLRVMPIWMPLEETGPQNFLGEPKS
jgi:hypothetical protein